MGFWKSFLGLENENKDNTSQTGKSSNIDTTFVTSSEETDFTSSIFGQLELLEADITYIEEVLPERGNNLRKQITLLKELILKTDNEDDPEVRKVFQELTAQFEEDRNLADGEYTLRQLEYQNKSMDKTFEASIKKDGITKAKLEEYLNYIQKIQEKVSQSDASKKPLLTKVKRQKFNEISMKSEYRIKMLELMYLLNIGEVDVNPFRNLSSSKQKMFSKYFLEDAKIAAEQYDGLSYYEEQFNSTAPYYFPSIDKIAKRLNSQLEDASMIEDFSIKQLFDSKNPSSESFSFLKDFIRFKTTMNQMRDEKEDVLRRYEIKVEDEKKRKERQEEQARVAEEKRAEEEKKEQEKKAEQERKAREEQEAQKQRIEKLKNMTDAEINAEIYRIEHDLKATGSRFVNILDFQKQIARAKGLLSSEEQVQSDKLVYKAVDANQAWSFIQNANKSGVNYVMFPDSQEFSDGKGKFLIAVSKTDKKSLEIEEKKPPFENFKANYLYDSDYTFGTFPVTVLEILNGSLAKEDDYDRSLSATKVSEGLYDLSYAYKISNSFEHSIRDSRKKKVYDELLKIMDSNVLLDIGSNPEELKDVMCYISFPVTRNIIPTLEAFRNSQVTPFLEPVPDSKRNTTSRDNIHIYFRREDLEKFKKSILPQISNTEAGMIHLNYDEMSFGEVMRDISKWPDEREFS